MKRNGKGGPRVLFIYKKSAYQLYVRERKHERFQELVERNDPTVSHVRAGDDAHNGTLEEAREAARDLGLAAHFRYRSDDDLVERFDLLVTIGGDGTLLWASRFVPPGIPVLGINSAPAFSVGHFCGGEKGQVREILDDAVNGRLLTTRLTRMEVAIDGDVVHKRVLNDALFCHRCPAATTRYLLTHGDVTEPQRSSGIWVGPAAGSTAAQRSAGGRTLPPGSRRLQYVIREPYEPPTTRYRLRRGLVGPGETLEISSQIREGQVFLDGPHIMFEVPVGSRLTLRRSDQPLTLLAFPRAVAAAGRRRTAPVSERPSGSAQREPAE